MCEPCLAFNWAMRMCYYGTLTCIILYNGTCIDLNFYKRLTQTQTILINDTFKTFKYKCRRGRMIPTSRLDSNQIYLAAQDIANVFKILICNTSGVHVVL